MLDSIVAQGLSDRHSANGGRAVPVPSFRWRLDAEVTIGLALVAGTRRLTAAGVDLPRLDSEVLLAHALGFERTNLYMYPERRLSDAQRRHFEGLIERRFKHEPVAYLVGRKAFYGLDLQVDSRVLIPRPETELLVELALDLVVEADLQGHPAKGENGSGPNSGSTRSSLSVVDVGTGSGAIALAIAANTRHTRVLAMDVSEAALYLARLNADRHGLSHRIDFLQGDLLAPLSEQVDLIVANLPYVATPEWGALAPDIVQYEPSLALSGGPDGLDVIRRLLRQAPAFLRPDGAMLLEIGSGQGKEVAQLAASAFPQASIEVMPDYGFNDRVVYVKT